MAKNMAIIAILALLLAVPLALAVDNVPSQPPSLPAIFSGSVTLDGSAAPAGTLIEAKIGGALRGTLTTSVAGAYNDPKLLVSGSVSDNGAAIYFYINGIQAAETSTWNSGAVYSLDISASTPSPQQTTGSSGGVQASSGSGSVKPNTTEFSGIAVNKIVSSLPAKITAVRLDAKPGDVASLPEALDVYGYFQITSDTQTSAAVYFKVEKSWIKANIIDTSTIKLYRYSGSWSALSTSVTNEDAAYVYYSAATPGFSIFAVAGGKLNEEPPVAICPEKRTKAYNPDTFECVEYPSECKVPSGWTILEAEEKCPVKEQAIATPTGLALGSRSPAIAALAAIIIAVALYMRYGRKRETEPKRKVLRRK